jgi:succinate dehydrogenase / fumarate reductase, cytochrome b subunit
VGPSVCILDEHTPNRYQTEESMIWLANVLWASIGKKVMMAATGLGFSAFLAVHLLGNLTLYGGGGLFNTYAEKLHQLGAVLTIAEWGLLFLAMVHVGTGITLFYENLRARPVRYKVNKRAGGRTIGSATMPYTGFFLLAFVTYHLAGFHFVDKTDQTIYQVVAAAFSQRGTVILYVLAMVLVAIHISHGFWSAFQSIGASHPKYTPIIKGLGTLFCLVVGFGFGLIPIYMFLLG